MAEPGGGPGTPHRPVLLLETVGLLAPERGGLFVDATLGLGGHSEALLEASDEARVLGIDRDPEALRLASERLARFGERFRAAHANHREIARVMREAGEAEASGVLADLGVSSLQFDTAERGFSFRQDAPLDMRMDASGGEETAAELLARLPEEEIARVIYEYGEERRSRRIARWIVERRERGEPIETTGALAELVARAVGYKRTDRIHPATRTFQALRIAVNGELEGLAAFLETSVDLLQAGGRLAVISFHSLEDRIVKRTLRRLAGQCECGPRVPVCSCGARRAVEILTRRPVAPTPEEMAENPRARSAKLRACSKL
ncbi:MAG TPA: 16S rRNA (cytosine(1402)-N(4))-methyltransferase RsmH [Pyrinomonadaceae bacterium]|nr:16S rRNA (cytosine(1402)-N(4))-methyltransferase RsmH [Pyrinomonadaceae bacterium]